MQVQVVNSKIHRVKVTGADLNYIGSITIDEDLMDAANMIVHEKSCGYHLYYKILNAADYGVPQSRKRVFIVGFRDQKDAIGFRFPKEQPLYRCVNDLLLPPEKVPERYTISEKVLKHLLCNTSYKSKINPKIAACLTKSLGKNGRGLTIIRTQKKIVQLVQAQEFGNQPRQQNRIYDARYISPTLTTRANDGVLKFRTDQYRYRRLMPIEASRLMGFPSYHTQPCSPTRAYQQYGNAIVVDVLAALFKQILNK